MQSSAALDIACLHIFLLRVVFPCYLQLQKRYIKYRFVKDEDIPKLDGSKRFYKLNYAASVEWEPMTLDITVTQQVNIATSTKTS